jgi:hypothetical protein
VKNASPLAVLSFWQLEKRMILSNKNTVLAGDAPVQILAEIHEEDLVPRKLGTKIGESVTRNLGTWDLGSPR